MPATLPTSPPLKPPKSERCSAGRGPDAQSETGPIPEPAEPGLKPRAGAPQDTSTKCRLEVPSYTRVWTCRHPSAPFTITNHPGPSSFTLGPGFWRPASWAPSACSIGRHGAPPRVHKWNCSTGPAALANQEPLSGCKALQAPSAKAWPCLRKLGAPPGSGHSSSSPGHTCNLTCCTCCVYSKGIPV